MSDREPDGIYVYQPKPPQPDGRIYAIGGLPYPVNFTGLTKKEAEACVAALRDVARALWPRR